MPCVELAEQLEVFLLIEPEPGLMIETFEQYLEFAERIGSPWLGLNFDIGHAFCVGQGPAELDCPDGARTPSTITLKTSPPRASTPIWCPAAGRLTFRPCCGKLRGPVTKAGSPSSCIRISMIPTAREGKQRSFLTVFSGKRRRMKDESEVSNESDRRSGFRSYLELMRLPNVFTAMADVAMGFLFVQPSDWQWDGWHDLWTLALLFAASSVLYMSGIVLNDVFDLEIDRRQRPERPLPSGRVSLWVARRLGWSLLCSARC